MSKPDSIRRQALVLLARTTFTNQRACGFRIGVSALEMFVRAGLGTSQLLKRVAEPVELAQAALFLASDESSYVTGTDMLVDGGFVLG